MEVAHSFDSHPTTDLLEEYAFARLSGHETEALEEHLLVCPTCQAELCRVDEFILMMKQADWHARRIDRRQRIKNWARSWGYSIATGIAVGGIFLALVAGEGGILRPRVAGSQAPVELLALRGGEGNRALAGRSMDLRIDLADLPLGRTYRIDIVNARGWRVWSGEVAASIEWLRANVGKPLAAGQYWVRLYSSGELVREFGL